jgi:RNA recognition motif-containing protein
MNTKLYVGNLSFDTNESGLRDLFTPFGQVNEAALILDRETQRPRGFAFVTMGSREEMDAAIAGLHDKTVEGRNLVVNEARARGDR